MAETFVVSGARVSEALAELGPDHSPGDVADALLALAEREAVKHQLERDQAEADAMAELSEKFDAFAADLDGDRWAAATEEAEAILRRCGRKG
jgi:hypothetical protein